MHVTCPAANEEAADIAGRGRSQEMGTNDARFATTAMSSETLDYLSGNIS